VADVVSQQNAEHYVWGGDCGGWHLLNSPGLSVIQERVPPGRREVRHYHQQAHQFFFVLSGRATLDPPFRISRR
jgi:mannose-6-phosphate isomerase-like protein (cupin superfamily)